MPAIQKRKAYGPPSLGLNTRFDLRTIHDLEASTLLNYQVNNDGLLEKYPGYKLDGSPFPASADSFIRTIYNFRRGSSINQLLVAAQDNGNANSTYKVDLKSTIGDGSYAYLTYGIGTATFTHSGTAVVGTNTSWTHELKAGDKIKLASDTDAKYTEISTVNSDTSITLVAGGYLGTTAGAAASYLARKIWNANNVIAITTFNNVAIIVDGNDIPQQYDGTNVFGLINSYSGTTITVQANAAPIAPFVTVHKNRVFMIDSQGNLFWSHAFDQTFWDPASTEPIFPQDGGNVVGFRSFGDSLVVFKDNGFIYRVFGNFDDSAIGTVAYVQKVDYSEKIGLISPRSICIHGNYLYFIAQTGIYTLDMRGFMQKISYLIDPETAQLNFGSAGTKAKSYNFTTTPQWNTGSHNGTYSTSSNQELNTFFDDYRITDAQQTAYLCAIAIGSDNTVYVAYVPAADNTQINFVRYRPGGTTLGGSAVRTETSILTDVSHGNVTKVSIAVSNADGTVGVAYIGSVNRGFYYIERTPDTQSPFAYGTWGNASNDQVQSAHTPYALDLIFSSGGVPYAASANSGTTASISFYTRSAGVWSIADGVDTGSALGGDIFDRIAIAIDGSANLYIAAQWNGNNTLYAYKSVNNGVTWTALDFLANSSNWDSRSALSIGFNHAGHFLSVLSDTSGKLQKRDHTAATTTTIATTSNSFSGGWFPVYNTLDNTNLDTDNYYLIVGSSPTQQEQVTSNYSATGPIGFTVSNPTLNVVTTIGAERPGMQPFVTNNGTVPGQTVAFIRFGTNANEIVIRRCCFYGYWQGPEQNDSTLTSWGTYVVTGPTGLNFTYEIALSSAHPATNFVTISSGAIISSNATLIYNIPRIEFSASGWNGGTVTSLVLNYNGSGIDARQIYGVSFYNEVYFAGCQTGQTSNNVVIAQDIKNAFLEIGYPVNCMEVFNNQLYGGSSLQGDVYILKNGLNFNTAAYTSTFVSKEDFLDDTQVFNQRVSLNSLELQKDFYKVYILYTPNSGSFSFSYRLDNYLTGSATWNTVTVPSNTTSGSNQNGIQEVDIKTTGRSIQFMIQDTGNNQYSAVLGFVLLYGSTNIR